MPELLNSLPANWCFAQWENNKLQNAEAPNKWGGKNPPPAIGATVTAYVNKLGSGTVASYFIQEGWLGVVVNLSEPHEWYLKQNKGNPPAYLFGPEIEPRKQKES